MLKSNMFPEEDFVEISNYLGTPLISIYKTCGELVFSSGGAVNHLIL